MIEPTDCVVRPHEFHHPFDVNRSAELNREPLQAFCDPDFPPDSSSVGESKTEWIPGRMGSRVEGAAGFFAGGPAKGLGPAW